MRNVEQYSRWMQKGTDLFIPSDNYIVLEKLPAGLFTVEVKETYDGTKITLTRLNLSREHLLDLNSAEEEYIGNLIDQFITKQSEFKKLGIAHKTGIMLYGSPGTGKTSILVSVVEKVMAVNGVAFLLKNGVDIYSFDRFYKTVFRKIEPDRLMLNIFEDIDGMAGEAETTLINILDGIGDCENTINLATTNYTERLSDRIVNRPGRFDRRIEIKSPSYDNREKYFRLRVPADYLKGIDLTYWVKETEHFTLAQLNEVVKSVLLLEEDFDKVVDTIRDMCKIPKSYDYNKETKSSVGFDFLQK